MNILVRGSGDIGSAIAHRLFSAGLSVAVHDVSHPTYLRRGMAFTDALFEGKAKWQSALAKRTNIQTGLPRMLRCGRAIPVLHEDFAACLGEFRPDVVVDARMKKREVPEVQQHLAPLTIGLGPNFAAGLHTHFVVETAWGDSLGDVITQGTSLPLAGDPREIDGLGRERCVYVKAGGVVEDAVAIGTWCAAGEAVGRVAGQLIVAPVSGYVRGICHSGVTVSPGGKVLEMDPRTEGAQIFGLGERPRKIAEAVVRIVMGQR